MKVGLHQTSIDSNWELLNGYNKVVPCPLCMDDNPKKTVFVVGDFEIVRCHACNLMYLIPMPSPQVLNSIYEKGYYKNSDESYGYYDYSDLEKMVKATYRRRFDCILRVVQKKGGSHPSNVHEVGAALGYGLQEVSKILPQADFSASDVSPEAVAACNTAGFCAYESDCFGRPMGLTKHHDMVYAFDVIEHISEPRVFVNWLAETLKPGGIAAVTTPDMMHPINRILGKKSPSIKVPQHVCYYSGETLAKLFGSRFTLLADKWDFQNVSIGFLLSRLMHILQIGGKVNFGGPEIIVPNGMKVFVFRKN